MDGVLLDNREYHSQAWAVFLERYSDKSEFYYEDLMRQFFGKTNQRIFEYLHGRILSAQELAYWEDVKESIYREIISDYVMPLNGLPEFLQTLLQNNIPMGIGTSGPMANVEFVTGKMNIKQYFSEVVDANQVTNGKPDPEIFLTVAQRLGVQAKNCVVFEDSISGVQAGINAGMKVVGVTTEHPDTVLLEQGAKFCIADFSGITLEQLYRNIFDKNNTLQ